jgi:hypothetical protein
VVKRARCEGTWAWGRVGLVVAATLVVTGCSGASASPSPPCDQTCMDQTALLSLRDAVKLIYNLTLQGNPVGPQDATFACPLGGGAHVFGTATSNAVQGATNVNLTYVLAQCAYSQQDPDATQNFDMTVNGQLTENGTLAAQPSSTTALEIDSSSMDLTGTVYNPPLDYDERACSITVSQNGNNLSGLLCGRQVGLVL